MADNAIDLSGTRAHTDYLSAMAEHRDVVKRYGAVSNEAKRSAISLERLIKEMFSEVLGDDDTQLATELIDLNDKGEFDA